MIEFPRWVFSANKADKLVQTEEDYYEALRAGYFSTVEEAKDEDATEEEVKDEIEIEEEAKDATEEEVKDEIEIEEEAKDATEEVKPESRQRGKRHAAT